MPHNGYMLGINTIAFPISDKEKLDIIKNVGFDAFFTGMLCEKEILSLAEHAARLGLVYQSLHAPFGGIDCMWKEGEAGEKYLENLKGCIDLASFCGIDIVVVHPFIGFHEHTPNELGCGRYLRLVEHAEKKNVVIAFENVEGEEYLEAIMKTCTSKYAAFCLDTGHEMCYNRSVDRLALYGDRLVATHFNDNLGISSKEGIITPADDLHLLPFDGIADWQNVMDRIRAHNYKGIITFELKITERYKNMSAEEFYKAAYDRAVKVVSL